MRKLVNITLVFLLLLSTPGTAISQHFCGKILQSISVGESAGSCCGDEDMPDNDNCCSDQVNVSKAEVFQLSQLTLNLSFSPFILYITNYSLFSGTLEGLKQSFFITFFNSPPITEQEIFVLVQSFLL